MIGRWIWQHVCAMCHAAVHCKFVTVTGIMVKRLEEACLGDCPASVRFVPTCMLLGHFHLDGLGTAAGGSNE